MQEAVQDRASKMVALYPVTNIAELEILIQQERDKQPGRVCSVAAINAPAQVILLGKFSELWRL